MSCIHLTGPQITRSAYTLDANSNPTLVETESGPVAYAYDERDRLVEACYAASCDEEGAERESFAYDSIGNLTERSGPEGTTSFDYDDSSRLTSIDGPEGNLDYGHDSNGNVTEAGDRTYAYDQLNRITTASTPDGEVTYAYDGHGLRTRAEGPAGSSSLAWDKSFPLPQVATETGPAGKSTYAYGAGRTSQSSPEGSAFFHSDALGSTRALTTPKGTIAARESYRPYGEQRSGEGEDKSPFGFTGERREHETGLYYLRARDYDPASGRFLQADPLTSGVGEPWRSSYSYVGGRPTALTDPTGMDPYDPLGGAGGGAGIPAGPGSPGGASFDGSPFFGAGPGSVARSVVPNASELLQPGGYSDIPGSLNEPLSAGRPLEAATLLASASDRPDPLKSGEVEFSIGPFEWNRGANTDDNETFGGFGIEPPLLFPGEGDQGRSSRLSLFGVHGTVNTGEVDSDDDSLGVLGCAGFCLGLDTDTGFSFGVGADLDVNVPDDVPLIGGF